MRGGVNTRTRKPENVPPSGPIQGYAFRLLPNDLLKESLQKYAKVIFGQYPEKVCSSAFVMTAVGSLCEATLRLANASNNDENDVEMICGGGSKNDIKKWENKRFEVVSLVGTFSRDGACHLHISLSDEKGDTIGGHLIEGKVFTTVEVVLGIIHGVEFSREFSESTGYRELVTRQLSAISPQSSLTSIFLLAIPTLAIIVKVFVNIFMAE